jgi:hypothetical protein
MPVLDDCHPQVGRTLQKAEWRVSLKPFTIPIASGHVIHLDIKAEHSNNGQKQTIIVMEVKCFPASRAATTELYMAVGQYIVYRSLLIEKNMDFPLYLVVPSHAYHTIFQRMGMSAIKDNRIKMIVIDLDREEIEQWIE